MRHTLLAAALAFGASACATAPVRTEAPTARLAESHATLRAARDVGAAQVPEAATYLAFAQQQVIQAEQLMAQGENEAADLQLRQAAADARLAFALAQAVPLENEARRLAEQAESLRRGLR
ncbi:DUF4398 domain-containing protein [Stigmatella sp. ncwal1]|uniref:DUF4398 domain-containing protein n=1 Tax=Stigmatella ashevillensis TaxID=2995309 RepID=A0ABT5DGM0_9BACT|nr:DUF4398 domain-containing protein [Stigmatella ashevillena]MDC0711482.1 DUF4398 domain-containing protein [Stigmatella ashevillena]